ncbi:13403_t:CDS:1, partial [Racocetra persica]
AMNTQVYKATKATLYELVYGQEACSDLPIISMLHQQNIIHEENIQLENQPLNSDHQIPNSIYNDTQLSNLTHDNIQSSNFTHSDTQSSNTIYNNTQLSNSIYNDTHNNTQLLNSIYNNT